MILKNKQYYYWNYKTVKPWIKYDIEMNDKFSYINRILFDNVNIKKNKGKIPESKLICSYSTVEYVGT